MTTYETLNIYVEKSNTSISLLHLENAIRHAYFKGQIEKKQAKELDFEVMRKLHDISWSLR